MLWKPSVIVREDCAPMTAIQFNGRFCLEHPEITTLSMGIHELEHFPQNLSILSEEKIYTDKEQKIRGQMDGRLNEVAELCTICNECLPCPEEINIPEVLRFRNLLQAYDMEDYGKFRYNMFEGEGHWFPGNFASRCTECGDCLPRCPERLEIPKLLFDTHRHLFDKKAWLKSKLIYFLGGIYRFFSKFAAGIN